MTWIIETTIGRVWSQWRDQEYLSESEAQDIVDDLKEAQSKANKLDDVDAGYQWRVREKDKYQGSELKDLDEEVIPAYKKNMSIVDRNIGGT